jgi:hypothetical protein
VTWSTTEIDARIDEYKRLRSEPGLNELTLLETALFIEEVFGVPLSDDEISNATIGTYDSMRHFVNRKLGLE